MSQVTIYMDDDAIARAKAAAGAAKLSLSAWMAKLVKEQTRELDANGYPKDFWEMAGSWSDSDFPDLDEIRKSEPPQSPRESF
jgi:muconolactone delta-isomerase